MIIICMIYLFIYIKLYSNYILDGRDPTPPTTPERFRNAAQQNERDQRVLDSPEHHRTPHHVQIAQLGASVPPPVFMPPAIVPPPPPPPPPPIYSHLPAHLAQQYLYPSVAPVLAPAFVPAPARYSHLPADLAQCVAALPPLMEHGRGRGRGRSRSRGRGNDTTVPAPLPFSEIAARYAALPYVSFFLVNLR